MQMIYIGGASIRVPGIPVDPIMPGWEGDVPPTLADSLQHDPHWRIADPHPDEGNKGRKRGTQ